MPVFTALAAVFLLIRAVLDLTKVNYTIYELFSIISAVTMIIFFAVFAVKQKNSGSLKAVTFTALAGQVFAVLSHIIYYIAVRILLGGSGDGSDNYINSYLNLMTAYDILNIIAIVTLICFLLVLLTNYRKKDYFKFIIIIAAAISAISAVYSLMTTILSHIHSNGILDTIISSIYKVERYVDFAFVMVLFVFFTILFIRQLKVKVAANE